MVNIKQFSLLVLFSGMITMLSGCATHSDAPLLSAPPSATADNDIYMADGAARIRAFRPDGTEQWSYSLAEDLARLNQRSSHDFQINYLSARSGGMLFGLATQVTGGHAGETFLFVLEGNRLVWQRSVPYPAQDIRPLIVGRDGVYEAANDGLLYAFARSDGRLLWQYYVGTMGAPDIGADGTIYVTGPRHNLHALNPDGTQKWVVEAAK